MMKMIKESTEQLSKQISSNMNNFIAHPETVSNISKRTEALLLHRKSGELKLARVIYPYAWISSFFMLMMMRMFQYVLHLLKTPSSFVSILLTKQAIPFLKGSPA
ncbi:unnamed protein product [Caretta caretta]